MTAPLVIIASPALADANNGNWQTARRWSRLLAGQVRTQIVKEWCPGAFPEAVALLALHARRSADSIAAWGQVHPGRGLTVRWPGGERRFALGESIHTENSYKYRQADFQALLLAAGYSRVQAWTDERGWFGMFWAPG